MATKTATKKANTRTNSMAEPSVAEVPMTEPLDLESHSGFDGLDENVDLGTKSKEVVFPEGAFVAGIPDWLPLYRDESVTETFTKGDVTWYHTDKDRWLTTKGVVPQATVVFHGPNEPFPEPQEIRDHNRELGKERAKQIDEEQRVLNGRATADPDELRAELAKLGQSKQLGHGIGSEEAEKSKAKNLAIEEADGSDVFAGMNRDVLVAIASNAGIETHEVDDEKLREALREKSGNAPTKSERKAEAESAEATGGAKGGDE